MSADVSDIAPRVRMKVVQTSLIPLTPSTSRRSAEQQVTRLGGAAQGSQILLSSCSYRVISVRHELTETRTACLQLGACSCLPSWCNAPCSHKGLEQLTDISQKQGFSFPGLVFSLGPWPLKNTSRRFSGSPLKRHL